jgi:hypothetical protein
MSDSEGVATNWSDELLKAIPRLTLKKAGFGANLGELVEGGL